MLKKTKTYLEFIPDPDMHMFFEKGIKGGVCYISNRYCKANNNYFKSYDPKQESKYIIYLDANNSYGYEMSNFLATRGIKWIDPKEFHLKKYTSNSWKGYVLEVDLKYPKKKKKNYANYAMITF